MKLDNDFEDNLEAALLDEIEQKLQDEIGPHLKQTARENFKTYASANGYDIDFIWENAEGPFVERDGDGVILRIEWPELSALFEFGVDPHVIEGNPTLSFTWQSPPEGTRPAGAPKHVETESVNWGSVTGGIDESRAVRDAMNDLRRLLS